MSIEVVRRIKAELEFLGVNLAGPCGAFEITNRVALALGAGVLEKASGNNCRGRAVDYIVFPLGPSVDILGDAGGANTPQWLLDNDPALLRRYVPPFALDVDAPPPQPPVPSAPRPDANDLVLRLAAIETKLASLTGAVTHLAAMIATQGSRHLVGDVRVPYLGTVTIDLVPKP